MEQKWTKCLERSERRGAQKLTSKRALQASKGWLEKMSEMQQFSNVKNPRHVQRGAPYVSRAIRMNRAREEPRTGSSEI